MNVMNSEHVHVDICEEINKMVALYSGVRVLVSLYSSYKRAGAQRPKELA